MLTAFIIIQLILIVVIYFISRRLYTNVNEDDNGNYIFLKEDRLKLPIIVYIGYVLLSIIPIFGLYIHSVVSFVIIGNIIDLNLYYKFSKILKFLFK